MEPVEVYAATRAAVAETAAGLPPERLGVPVPACPGWTVGDLVAHLVGVAADHVSGRLAGAPSPQWTEAQVAARRGLLLATVLAEWSRVGPELERQLPALGRRAAVYAVDAVTHRHDLHGALDLPPPAYAEAARGVDVATFRFALAAYADGLGRRLAAAGLPPVRLDGGDWTTPVGGDAPAVTVRAPTVELFRGLAGRRSDAQVRAWDWSDDPSPYLPLLSQFGPLPSADVVEWGGYAHRS